MYQNSDFKKAFFYVLKVFELYLLYTSQEDNLDR